MEELEKNARELILAITEKTLRSLKDKGLLKEPSKLQMLCSSPEMESLLKKLSAPKYDPNREFRVGDKVSVRKIHGKLPQCRYNGMVKVKEGDCCTIHEKEHRNCYWVTIPSGGNWCFDAAYLELVTPVEELEPYKVYHDKELSLFEVFQYELGEDSVEKEGELYKIVRTTYWYGARQWDRTEEEAKAEAEAERDRLNAEWRRKEQE